MSMIASYQGLLLIGDPHLEGRQPGFRRDDYPNVILDKLAWSLNYARKERLLPAILGDLFDKPRDNPNWLISRLFDILRGETLGLYGNHDVHHNPELTENDSLNLLVQAGRIRLVTSEAPWSGVMRGREVIVGGSSYRQALPERFDLPREKSAKSRALVIWLTHHDIMTPGYDEGRIRPQPINGVDLVINGHIHRRLADVPCGDTLWLTPGNISRRSRNDASREHIPSVLRLDVFTEHYELSYVRVPHEPFDDVFHPALTESAPGAAASAFVTGLAELQSRQTASGAGLIEFLNQNLGQFDVAVAREILNLAKEVTNEEQ